MTHFNSNTVTLILTLSDHHFNSDLTLTLSIPRQYHHPSCMLGEFIHKLAGVPHYIIDGAGHVPYILNQGSDFVSAIDMGERVGKMKSQASRMAACLEHQHDKWAEFICLPSPHLSGTSPLPHSLFPHIYLLCY